MHLRLERTLAAPPVRVWHALTDADELTRWFWPASYGTLVEVDLRPGGSLRIDAPGLMGVQGEYVDIDPPRLLAFTWQWNGEAERTAVRVELSPVDGGTRLVLVHEGFADPATRESHTTGWSDCLDRLPAHLAGDDRDRALFDARARDG
jgi:uncharacterized protein YndB with AHSA1/START domain